MYMTQISEPLREQRGKKIIHLFYVVGLSDLILVLAAF